MTPGIRRAIAALNLICCLLVVAAAQNTPEDPLLKALQEELQRSKQGLKLDGVQPPYFIQYNVSDTDTYVADSAFGALRSEQRAGARMVRVVVRVGDYRQDSFFGQGEGVVDIIVRENNVAALRQQLWWATDQAYKKAAEALSAKQAVLKQYEVQQAPDDFSRQDPVTQIDPLRELDLTRRDWPAVLNSISGLYRQDPETQSFDAWARFVRVNEYIVNTEGTTTRTGYTTYSLRMHGSTQAADGMRLGASQAYVEGQVTDLPTDDKLRSDAVELLATLKALRSAPLVDDEYRGPVLLSQRAAWPAIHNLVAENLLGRRPRPGVPARTTGAFANSLKSPVLPESISLLDDPNQEQFGGRHMLGHYVVDGEGVRPSPVHLVEKGVLTNYLMGRHPIRDFPASNGHGRGSVSSAPGPAIGNLIMSSTSTMSPGDLKKKLLEMCRARGLPYGYYVAAMGQRLAPTLLYKVRVADGHEEVVRGAEFAEFDTRSMRTGIVGVGNDFRVDNVPEPAPYSMVTPSILIDELVVKRTSATKEKLPSYPAPAPSTAK